MPEKFRKFFWDVDYDDLSMEKYPAFIAERLMNFGDLNGIRWLLAEVDLNFIRSIIKSSRNLNPKTRNYWQLMLENVDD